MTASSSPRNGRASVLAASALALTIGTMALAAPASAEETNPLLGKGTEVVALSSDQMNEVQGTGYWANYYGSLGMTASSNAYWNGYYARYSYRGTSYEPYYYGKAANYAYNAYKYYNSAKYYANYGW